MAADVRTAACVACSAPRVFSHRCHSCGALFPGEVPMPVVPHVTLPITPPPTAPPATPVPAGGTTGTSVSDGPPPWTPSAPTGALPLPGPSARVAVPPPVPFSSLELQDDKKDGAYGINTRYLFFTATTAPPSGPEPAAEVELMIIGFGRNGEIFNYRTKEGLNEWFEPRASSSSRCRGDLMVSDIHPLPPAPAASPDLPAGRQDGWRVDLYASHFPIEGLAALFFVLAPKSLENAAPLKRVTCAITKTVEAYDPLQTAATPGVDNPDFMLMEGADMPVCTACVLGCVIPTYMYWDFYDLKIGFADGFLERMPDTVSTVWRVYFPYEPPTLAPARDVWDSHVTVGLGWHSDVPDIDLDLACIVVTDDLKIADVCSFNRQSLFDGAITHSGDVTFCWSPFSYGPVGNGDNEQITIDFSRLPPNVKKLYFTTHVYHWVGNSHVKARVRVTSGSSAMDRRNTVTIIPMSTESSPSPDCDTLTQFVVRISRPAGEGHRFWAVSPMARGTHGQTWADVVHDLTGYLDAARAAADPEAILRKHEIPQTRPTISAPFHRELQFPGRAEEVRICMVFVRRTVAPPYERPKDYHLSGREEEQCLLVRVCGGINLLGADKSGTSDVYVYFYIQGRTHYQHKRSSDVEKKTNNPIFGKYGLGCNGIFPAPFTPEESLRVEVYDKDFLSSEPLGSVDVRIEDTHHRGPVILHLTGKGPKGGPAPTGFLIVKYAWLDFELDETQVDNVLISMTSKKWGCKAPSCYQIHPETKNCDVKNACYPMYSIPNPTAGGYTQTLPFLL